MPTFKGIEDTEARPEAASKGRGSTGAFVTGALSTVLVLLGLVGLFNWWQNPFDEFQPFIPPVSQRLPGAVLEADREQQMRWLIHEGERSSADTLLIGTSQMLHGVDTCGYPGMKRLALYSLTDAEIARLLRAVAPGRREPTTFLIGEGLSTQLAAAPPDNGFFRWWHDLFSHEAIETSAANFAASLQPGPPPCAAMPSTAVPGDSSPGEIEKTLGFLKRHIAGRAGLDEVLAAVEPSCSRLHHTVVIARTPVLFMPKDAGMLQAIEAEQARMSREVIAAFNARNTGCTVYFEDFATPYIVANAARGPDRAEWYDTWHFTPALGRTFLQAMLAAAKGARGPL